MPISFAKFLEQHGICTEDIVPGSPKQNGVVESCNQTFINMVWRMIYYSSLPKSLCMYALKTIAYLLNSIAS